MPYLDANRQLPFQTGSATSRDAAIRAQNWVGPQGDRVLAWLQGRANGTQKECARELGIDRASACARFRALEIRGDIEKTEDRRGGCTAYAVVR